MEVGVGGKRIDDDVTAEPSARSLSLPPWRPKVTERLIVDVREAPRVDCHDATLASNRQGPDSFDTIACEAETWNLRRASCLDIFDAASISVWVNSVRLGIGPSLFGVRVAATAAAPL